MDLSEGDLEVDCCPTNDELPLDLSKRGLSVKKTEDRFYSTCSSGYGSGNLDSGLHEDRFASEEDKLVPVEGLKSLTLEHEEKTKEQLASVDEGFVSENLEESVKLREQDVGREASPDPADARFVEEIFSQDEDGDTRLHTSIIQFLTDLSLFFIAKCPTPGLLNLRNNYLQSPLHLAVITKNDVVTRKLMSSGSQVDARDHRGNTPLHVASREGHEYFTRILLEPVHYEETKGNNYELPYQQIPQNMEARNYDGQMCVHLAAEGCHIRTLDVLLMNGANVNARDGKSGRTILHYAAESGCMELIKYLITQKHRPLDLNSLTYGGLTPIMLAKGRGHEEAVRVLKEAGAFYDSDESSEEESMNEDTYDDIKINGIIVNRP